MLTPGDMPWDVFPLDTWARLHKRIATQLGVGALRPGAAAGYMPLRQELARRLGDTLGRSIDAAHILILPSRAAALRLVAGALLDDAREAWVESPGDSLHRAAILGAIGTPIGFRADPTNIQVALARGVVHTARFALVSLGASTPIGARFCNARRAALHHWASGVDGWFVEDDLGGNLLLDPTITAAGSHPRSVLVGSFGKIAAPGIDLAYVVAPPAVAEQLLAELMLSGNDTLTLHQAVLHGFITSGALDAHLDRLRREATVRFDAFCSGITRYLEPGRSLRADALTFTATIDLEHAAAERELVASCRVAGFGVMRLSDFCDPALPSFGLVLGFGGASAARLETEAARLGMLLRARAVAEKRADRSAPAHMNAFAAE
ncbi:hypothetical protein [Roseiterribacter gracilis]|uniref:Aminotransferase class I/classII domain-containing protein n=1 Tax=Roseiterribacter gracilis TaxID=2812848 RepID=A0A8S8XHI2_9PROT|nr:hypothetical protein TMPK1_29430 [Rhodospirillales bacterium TMPK1]